ncbi:hypothetical protein WR25_00816 [Diploscapter pachys]|uniref:Cyclin-like domain-containing protein n=1 Tax=Diploscapter pachys TaxID=2018661 RepID=A0A2A2JV41_9BILA|nr:hypothetical protein WR25_00816 [Diploscapter pachys]
MTAAIRVRPVDAHYVNAKNNMIKAERRLLSVLGFVVHVKHPHKLIISYMYILGLLKLEEQRTDIVQKAWSYMNDGLRTDMFLRYTPETIACACIYLAARTVKEPVPLPNQPLDWFELFDASDRDVKTIALMLLKLYTRKRIPNWPRLQATLESLRAKKEAERKAERAAAVAQKITAEASEKRANGRENGSRSNEDRDRKRDRDRDRDGRKRTRSRSRSRERRRRSRSRDRKRNSHGHDRHRRERHAETKGTGNDRADRERRRLGESPDRGIDKDKDKDRLPFGPDKRLKDRSRSRSKDPQKKAEKEERERKREERLLEKSKIREKEVVQALGSSQKKLIVDRKDLRDISPPSKAPPAKIRK